MTRRSFQAEKRKVKKKAYETNNNYRIHFTSFFGLAMALQNSFRMKHICRHCKLDIAVRAPKSIRAKN